MSSENTKTNYETTIGVLNITYEHYEIVDVRSLKNELCGDCYHKPKEYCDFRFETNLRRFNYDPYTGDKIDWKEVRKLLEEKNVNGRKN